MGRTSSARNGSESGAARAETAEILLADRRVPYRLQRSGRRRTVGLLVDAERGLVVYAPQRLALYRVESILRQKARWILDKTAEATARQRRPRVECTPGQPVPWRGGAYPLALERGPRRALSLQAEAVGPGEPQALALRLTLPARTLGAVHAEGYTHEAVYPHLETAYREAARAELEARVAYFAPLLRVTPRTLRVKGQQRRWGSASAKGALNFNWRLILAPPAVLDYVVVHELAHLRELNHSPRFWALVASVVPEHALHRAWLRRHGASLYDL